MIGRSRQLFKFVGFCLLQLRLVPELLQELEVYDALLDVTHLVHDGA